MTQRSFSMSLIFALVALPGSGLWLSDASAAPPVGADVADGGQVLTRGPIHEAFAEPVVFDPKAGVIAAKAPPAAIEEIPPDQRPEGANVAWIPGYWSWDDERSDFLWVSGIWRALPPGRQWMPGYWAAAGQSSVWTSGYWADASASEVEYLPEPPATVEAGPNVAAPSPNDSWFPGSWVWQQSRYAWQPGSWATVQPDRVWIPAQYVWSPRGYVFVGGYWDYLVGRRGVLFAPVVFNAAVSSRPGFFYSPITAIDLGVFADQLFVRPSYCSYYFGDYYAAGYAASGFYSSFAYQPSRYGYDPIFAHQSWEHRGDSGWGRQVQATFLDRRDHPDARPPRTVAAQNALASGAGNSANRGFVAAVSLDQLATRQNSPLRFQPVTKEERQGFAQHGQEVQKFGADRAKLEARTSQSQAGTLSKGSEPTRMKLPMSPLASKPVDQVGRDSVPPRTHEVLKPELNTGPKGVEAQPRPPLQSDPQPRSGAEPQPRSSLEPQPKPRVEPLPKREIEPQPRPTLQPEPRPQPKAETQPRTAPAPQPQPKAEPQPHSAPQPQPEPRAETQPHSAPPTAAPQSKATGETTDKSKK